MSTPTLNTTTPTRSADLEALRAARDALLGREAQRADALAREMAEAEVTHRYDVADELRATINEDRADDLDQLLDLLSPCPECESALGAVCTPECRVRTHSEALCLGVLDIE